MDLSPPVLHDEGLTAAMRWLASQMSQQQGLTVEVAAESALPRLNEDLRVLLFQTVRELLFNVVKHAGVTSARVALSQSDGHLRIDVSDNGRGFSPVNNGGQGASQSNSQSNSQSSQGLPRIGQRMQLLGGRMEIASAAEQGTRITLYVPVHGREERNA